MNLFEGCRHGEEKGSNRSESKTIGKIENLPMQKKCICATKVNPRTAKNIRKLPQTLAIIKCDIGFGNTLFIRGEGAKNLGWDKGLALTFDEKEHGWCFRTSAKCPIEFKVLINDRQWSEGENFTLSPGGTQTFEPNFLYG